MPRPDRPRAILVALIVGGIACGAALPTATPQPDGWFKEDRAGFSFWYKAPDRELAAGLISDHQTGIANAQSFLGLQYKHAFEVRVFPARAELTAHWQQIWATWTAPCWLIAVGIANEVTLLSPRQWSTETCGHTNTESARRTLAWHEVAHVLHGQYNTNFNNLLGSAPWVTEGIAVYTAGEFSPSYLTQARAIVRSGFSPTTFTAFWAQQANYSLAGSLFAYIDQRYGRQTLRDIIAITSPSAFPSSLGLTEQRLLVDWRAWMIAP